MLKLLSVFVIAVVIVHALPAEHAPEKDLLNPAEQPPAPATGVKTPGAVSSDDSLSGSDNKDESLDRSETIWGFGRPYYGGYGGWGGYGGYGGYGGGYGGWGRGFGGYSGWGGYGGYGGWRRPYYSYWG